MELQRRTVLAGALAATAAISLGLPAEAAEVSLGKTKDFQTKKPRVLTVAKNRILVYRLSTSKFSVLESVCPHDQTPLQTSHVKLGKITCPKDRSVFSAVTGARLSGPSKSSLKKISHRVSGGVLLANFAAATASATPTPTQSAKALCKKADVPVASGLRVESSFGPLVVVQPTVNNFGAFSAICTHAGCEVSEFGRENLICMCHGSEFSTFDGAVSRGPARQALKKYALEILGDEIFLKS